METTTGQYQVKALKNHFIVIYKWNDGDEMVMIHKYYATELGATKAMNKLKLMAGVN